MKNAIKVICFVLAVLIVGISSVYIYFTWDIGTFEVIDGADKGTVIISNYIGTSKDVEIPKSLRGKKVVSIGETAFKGSDITTVVIGDNIKSIGNNAFDSCKSLESVVMGDSVESIGNMAFANCDSLKSVKFSAGLKDMGHMVLGNVKNDVDVVFAENSNFKFVDGIIYSADMKIMYESLDSADLSDYVLPETVVELKPYAFYAQKELKSIELNNGIKTIPEGCFISCEGLTELVLPNSVTIIDTVIFAGSGITTITIPASVVKIDEHALISDGSEITINLFNKNDDEDEENSESADTEETTSKLTIITTEGSYAATYARRHKYNLTIVESL